MYLKKKISKTVENTIKLQVFKKAENVHNKQADFYIKLPLPPCYHTFLLSIHPYLSNYYCKNLPPKFVPRAQDPGPG